MPSEPLILAFDTSAAHCAAALLRGDEIIQTRSESMTRGQAERLMPLLEELLTAADYAWRDLDAIGVGVGPGNFTGIRVSVSAARGLALGLDAPAVGISGFEALEAMAPLGTIPAISAPRDQFYISMPDQDPTLVSRTTAESLGQLYLCEEPEKLVCSIARLAARRHDTSLSAPAPLYVRQADAAPSRDVPPVLLDT